ncbi:MAG: Gfo/Idh/MocA family oxidoreductase [Spirochaetales bacterium]
MIRAAVVGLGIGLAHCAGYLKSPHARLVAVCDPVEARRKTVGGTFSQGSMAVLKPLFSPDLLTKQWEELGVKTYATLEEVVEDPDIDLVSLCTPDYTHPYLGANVLNAGKHLYLEKPLGVRLEDCEILLEAARRSSCTVGVAYEFRLNPAILQVKKIIETGRIGRPEAFSLYHYRNSFRRDKVDKWIQKREFSGGLLVEETCHWFDLARYLMGREVETLHCVSRDCFYPDFDFEDIAYVNGTFQEGGILQISHALTGFDFSLIIQIHGTAGTVWCALKEQRYSALDGGETSWYALVATGPLNGKPEDAEVTKFGVEATEPENIRDAVIHFTEAIASGKPPLASLEDGYRSLELALLAGKSAQEKKALPYGSRYAHR